jgi:hypothetical protein
MEAALETRGSRRVDTIPDFDEWVTRDLMGVQH